MLVLSRRLNERIMVGDIVITVADISGSRVRIGIDAPKNIRIALAEVYSHGDHKNGTANRLDRGNGRSADRDS